MDNLDKCNASDLITPAATLLAIGAGGDYHRHKACWSQGISQGNYGRASHVIRNDCQFKDGGIIEVPGGQTLIGPKFKVETYNDHRVAMTALALVSRVGGIIRGHDCVGATHPNFTKTLLEYCNHEMRRCCVQREHSQCSFLMLLVAIIWGVRGPSAASCIVLAPATGAWMRYIVCMLAFYLWFFYKSARGDKYAGC